MKEKSVVSESLQDGIVTCKGKKGLEDTEKKKK
jgi:hypothetical protein